MTDADVHAAAALYAANARDAVLPEERAERGFVQGGPSADALRASAQAGHAYVAEIDGQLAGVTMTHPVERFASPGPQRPPTLTVAVVQQAGVADPILYGPSVVADAFRRRGVLTALTQCVLAAATESGYRTVVAFMEVANRASVRAHAQLGWERIGGFTFDGREYDVVVHPADGA